MTEIVKGEFVCVVCPNGCAIDAEFVKGDSPKLISAEGARCARGNKWVKQEIEEPMRTIATSVLVRNGDYICASVRTQGPVPLEKISRVMDAVRGLVLDAPVHIGQVLVKNPAGTETNIIATRNVARVP